VLPNHENSAVVAHQTSGPQTSSSNGGTKEKSVASSSSSSHAAAVRPLGPADAAPSAAGHLPVAPVREDIPADSSLADLVYVFDRQRLKDETELMDTRGLRLREGSTIIFTAHPSGTLMVQGEGGRRAQPQMGSCSGHAQDCRDVPSWPTNNLSRQRGKAAVTFRESGRTQHMLQSTCLQRMTGMHHRAREALVQC